MKPVNDFTGVTALNAMCLDLLNSEERDWHGGGAPTVDRLDDAEWRAGFVARWASSAPVGAAAWQALRRVRPVLRRAVEELSATGRLGETALGALNAELAALAWRERIVTGTDGRYRLQDEPDAGPDAMAGMAVRSLAGLLAEAEPERLKVCANSDCRWAFYDESKNHRRRWCDATACGNLMKVRRFRQRHRQGPASPSRG